MILVIFTIIILIITIALDTLTYSDCIVWIKWPPCHLEKPI